MNPKETSVPSGGAGAPISRRQSVGPSLRKRAKACQSESASSNARNLQESSDSEIRSIHEVTMPHHPSSPPKSKLLEKSGIRKRNSKRIVEQVLVAMRKRQKKMASDSDSLASGSLGSREMHLRSNSRKESEETSSSSQKVRSPSSRRLRRKEYPVLDGDKLVQVKVTDCLSKEIICDDTFKKEEFVDENIYKQDASEGKSWKPIEKALFEKGVEMFGRSRFVA